MTKKALAEGLGVSADAITKFENASCKPSFENVLRCAEILKFPESWFYDDEIELLDVQAPSFRSRRSMTKELRAKATRAGDIAASVISPFIHRHFHISPPKIPDLSDLSPLEAAAYLRVQFGLGFGPISNMVRFLEAAGVEVFWLKEQSSSLDAWSVWHKDKPFVLLNHHTEAGCRARFDAAHELGHLVLHRHAPIIEGLAFEKEANIFAGAFLMPPEQFSRECPRYPNLRAFFPLKKRWGVSIAAMIMQCQAQKVFSEWAARRAFTDLAAQGWRLQEPDEIAIPREQSGLHPLMWDRFQRKYSPASLAGDLKITLEDLQELMPEFKEREMEERPALRLVA